VPDPICHLCNRFVPSNYLDALCGRRAALCVATSRIAVSATSVAWLRIQTSLLRCRRSTSRAYCIYELRFSEDEAFRRVAAARLIRRFPALLDALASGELHLTGLLMLGPHLTEANLTEVLARAKHRTKRELARLVRVLDPLPSVPARIGAARTRASACDSSGPDLGGIRAVLLPGPGASARRETA
jgi:hypothetical protein